MKNKKTFYFIIKKSTRRTYGGLNEIAEIYTIKKGELVYCCDARWTTASYCGEKAEIMQALIKNGFIPKKYYKSSESPFCSGGYFQGVVCDKYEIKEIQASLTRTQK